MFGHLPLNGVEDRSGDVIQYQERRSSETVVSQEQNLIETNNTCIIFYNRGVKYCNYLFYFKTITISMHDTIVINDAMFGHVPLRRVEDESVGLIGQ
jgi:hypothetical protein